MKGPSILPGPIRVVVQWLFFSLLREGDDFTQTLRKIASAVLFIATPVPFGLALLQLYRAIMGAQKYGPHVEVGPGFLMGCVFSGNYIYLRVKGHMTDAHANALLIFIAVDWSFIYLCVPDYDPRTITSAVAIVSILTRPPHMLLILGYLFILGMITIYNQAYRHSGNTLLLVPGSGLPSGPAEDFVWQLSASLSLCLGLLGVLSQTAAHVAALRATEAGVRLSNDVVALLRLYDTDAVDRTLDEYEKAGDASANLLEAFRAMNNNLKVYRPHLPNYVLMRDTEDEEDGEPTSDTPLGRSVVVREALQATKGAAGTDTESHSSCNSADPQLPNARASNPKVSLTNASFRGRISIAMVDLFGLSLSTVHHQRDATSEVLDSLYDLATQFHAGVHATVGDVVVLSWNATRRLAQPELKASKFLCRLLRAAKEATGVPRVIGGAVFSGLATCSTVVSQGGKQHTLLLSAPWMEALDVAFRLAQHSRCGLIDGETNATASYELESRAVDRVYYIPRDRPEYCLGKPNASLAFDDDPSARAIETSLAAKKTVLFELVGELNRRDEEWMYQLAQPSAAQTESSWAAKAFEAASSGRFGDVVALFGQETAAPRDDSPLLVRMRNYCERQLLQH